MLTSIQAQQLHRFGAADIDETTGVFKPIVPIKYSNITFHPKIIVARNANGTSDVYTTSGKLFLENTIPTIQKYGIVVASPDSEGMSDAYTFDGDLALHRGFNILFLDNGLLLVSDKKHCYIYNYQTRKMVSAQRFDSILFFYGSNQQAQPYTAARDMSSLFNTPDYLKYGAHLENLICAKTDTGWGILDMTKKKIYKNFSYKVMVHCKGLNIGAKDSNGKEVTLSVGQ